MLFPIKSQITVFLIQERGSFGVGYLKEPFIQKKGFLEIPKKPGLGIELDEDAMEDKIGHNWLNKESYSADDDSVVDW